MHGLPLHRCRGSLLMHTNACMVMQWCCAMYVRCAECVPVPSHARLCRVHGTHLSELRVPDARLHACANVKGMTFREARMGRSVHLAVQ